MLFLLWARVEARQSAWTVKTERRAALPAVYKGIAEQI
jgi:hypothetical protein